jgi:hypothetical protein
MELRAGSNLEPTKVNVRQLKPEQSKCDGCRRVCGRAQGLACHPKASNICAQIEGQKGLFNFFLKKKVWQVKVSAGKSLPADTFTCHGNAGNEPPAALV